MATLVVGVPFSGRPLPPELVLCYAGWCTQVPMNFNARYYHTKGQPIDDARNFFAQNAVDCNAKYLFMWDEDVAVPPFALRQLVFWLEHNEDWGLVGGIYVQKNEPPQTAAPMVFKDPGRGPFWKWHAGEIFEVKSMGLGCSLLRVDALKDVPKPWFKTSQEVDAFLDNVPRGTMWTEDIWFCDRLNKTGKWKIMADGGLICDHIDLQSGKPYRLPENSYPMQRLRTKTGSKKIVDLGCGTNPMKTDEGQVVTVDVRKDVNPDYQCDLRRLPFATAEFDIVYSSHTLEHFPRNEVDAVLDEWIRILKPDGEFRMVLPSVAWAAEQISKGIIDDNVLNVLYGSQEYKENFHKVGFTPQTVKKMLTDKGFKKVDIQTEGFNMLIRAWRSKGKRSRSVKAEKR